MPRCILGACGFVALAATVSFANVCVAQSTASLREDELPPELRKLVHALMTQPRVSPGVAFGSPVGFGAAGGDYFFGLSGATSDQDPHAKGADNDLFGYAVDGSMAAGLGLGDPRRSVGIELAVNVVSMTDSFGDSGAVSIKLHRNIGARGAVAIGTENDLAWGDVKKLVDASTGTHFISYSHYFQLHDDPLSPGGLMLTAGVGDGRLGRVEDPGDAAAFLSVGYAFTRQMSVIADYSGEATSVAVSIVPWRRMPISAVLGITDISEERGDSEVAMGIGYSGRF